LAFFLNRLSIPHKEGGIRGLRIPLIADKSMTVTNKYGVLNEEEGIAYRFVSNSFI
jgi:alkyl hydroperoxide reductase subunit AhpC